MPRSVARCTCKFGSGEDSHSMTELVKVPCCACLYKGVCAEHSFLREPRSLLCSWQRVSIWSTPTEILRGLVANKLVQQSTFHMCSHAVPREVGTPYDSTMRWFLEATCSFFFNLYYTFNFCWFLSLSFVCNNPSCEYNYMPVSWQILNPNCLEVDLKEHPCLSFYCCEKMPWPKATWGGRGYFISQVTVHRERDQGRVSNGSRSHRGTLLRACSPCFYTASRTTVSYAFPHQPSSKKRLHMLAHKPNAWWGHFNYWGSLSQMTLAVVQLYN